MKVKITIPTELGEIKLHQYQKYISIAKDNDENDENDFLTHKMIQIFCNIDLNIVSQFKQKDLNDSIKTITELFNKVPPLVQKFELNGIEFGFIPNLDDITNGEYMDLDSYISDWAMMHKAMAVLYRPIKQKLGQKYLIEEYEGSDKYSELMKNAPLDVVLSSYVFFYHLGNELLKSTMTYLVEDQQMNIQNNRNLGNVGDGIVQSMHLLKEMLEDSMKLPNLTFINV